MEIDFEYQTGLFLGLYERELHPHLSALCQRGFKCLDVGAGVGYYSLLFAKLTDGKVLAFEVDDVARRQLVRNLSLNPALAGRISVVDARVGTRSDDENGVVSLDGVAIRTFDPDLIKIDTDGAEAEILEGAVGVLERRRPHVIVETHSLELNANAMCCFASEATVRRS
jgi:precorrin-6B methylase 2